MEQDSEQEKPIKIERLIQSIGELDEKINKLLAKRDALKSELENIQSNEILAIINSQYKTPEEITAFIKHAKSGGYMVELVKPKQASANLLRTEGANEHLEDSGKEKDGGR